MVKVKKQYCEECGGEVMAKYGLLYSDTYCCNCGATIRTRRTLFGKEIWLLYPRPYARDGVYWRTEVKNTRHNNKRQKYAAEQGERS